MRAVVSPEFIDLVASTAKEKMQNVFDLFEASSDRSTFAKKYGGMIKRLNPIIRKDEMAIDRLKTNLRGLEYQSFNTHKVGETMYFVGKTKSVKIGKYRNSLHTVPYEFYDAGAYWVYIKQEHFLNENVDFIQMIPERDPRTTTRHPHVTVNLAEISGSPLEFTPFICWSGFAQLVSGAVEDHDIVSLYRYIYLYLSRWAQGSEYGNCEFIPFIINYRLETA